MKKKISKILGVGISLALLTGLVVSLTPASAQDIKALTWGIPFQPGNGTQWSTSSILWDTRWGILNQINIVDTSVSADGQKVYVVCGPYEDQYGTYTGATGLHRVYTADYGGYLWTGHKIQDEDGDVLVPNDGGGNNWSVDLVAQAPDDADVVAVAVSSDNVSTAPVVYFSLDGGTSWDTLRQPSDTTAVSAADTILSLDVSHQLGSVRYILAGGEDGGVAGLWYYALGDITGSWVDAASQSATTLWDTTNFEPAEAVWAAKFSPNFPADRTVVVVTGPEGTATDTKVQIQLASFAGETWNSEFYDEDWEYVVAGPITRYGRPIEAITTTDVVLAASISMPDSYMGSASSLRVVFIGLATNDGGGQIGNIYRFDDEDRTRLLGDDADDQTAIRSVAISADGENLVAGAFANNNVIFSANPLVNEPDCYDCQNVKRPGGNDDTNQVIVAWGGTQVMAGSSGYNSAFSVSDDSGNSFNDIGMIDSDVLNIEDFFITDAGYPYIVTNDGPNLSFWRQSPWSNYFWIRALVLDDDTGYIVRVAPEDNNVIYLAKTGAGDREKRIYYSSDGGDTEWLTRYCGVVVQDLAVESADVVYALSDAGKISRSTDGGFVWSDPATDSKQTTGHSIISMGVNQVLMTSKTGGVSYSTDGETWTSMVYTIGSGETQVVAEGFATGDNLYAVRSNSNNVYRWTYGTNTTAWTLIGTLDTTQDEQGFFGLALVDGVLYAASCNVSDALGVALATPAAPSYMYRHLDPGLPEDQVDIYWDEEVNNTAAFSITPQALRIGSGSNMVWAIDNNSLVWYLDGADGSWDGYYPQIWRYEDSVATAGPTLSLPGDGMTVPANRESGLGYDVVLTWEQLSRATTYEMDLAYDVDFTQMLLDGVQIGNSALIEKVTVTTGNIYDSLTEQYLEVQLVPGYSYYWRVKAYSPIRSPWSETWSFTVLTLAAAQAELEPPPVEEEPVLEPEATGPALGADEVSIRPTFTWTAIPGATYEIVLAEDLDDPNIEPFEIIDWSATCDINAYVAKEALKYSTTYHWRVRAITADATGEWVRGMFTTMAEPVTVEPTPPVIIEEKPAPEITLEIPPTPSPVQVIPDWALYTIIVVGAVLVISVIVLIVRTRRVV